MLKIACLLLSVLFFRGNDAIENLACSLDTNVAEPGDTLTITCTTESQYFEHSFTIHKSQHDGSDVVLAVLGNEHNTIGEIFQQLDKVAIVETNHGEGHFEYTITVADLQPYDTGKYGLLEDMQELVVSNSYLGDLILQARRDDGGEFRVVRDQEVLHIDKDEDETEHWEFICSTDAGSVEPAMIITYGEDDYSDKFTFTPETHEVGVEDIDSDHFQYTTTTVTAQSNGDIEVDKSHKNSYLTCTASVEGHDPKSIGVTFSFRSAPEISCNENTIAGRGKPVTIICEVEADPEPASESISWTFVDLYENPVTLGDIDYFELMNISTSKKMENGRTLTLSLDIPTVYLYSFTSYELSVGNAIGESSATVNLIHDEDMDVEAVKYHENGGSYVITSLRQSIVFLLITYFLNRFI